MTNGQSALVSAISNESLAGLVFGGLKGIWRDPPQLRFGYLFYRERFGLKVVNKCRELEAKRELNANFETQSGIHLSMRCCRSKDPSKSTVSTLKVK